ncbi:uncharacterized protein LOC124138882 [Haliotis rufescens]|uniref:uncharacterized protein LOC124138882 n=1 Tax=Haliotis rufescens TaxID=6454 RepID=UPI001EB01FEC|nr:uncharacterized protein LOC124138882 [Haliotis rufescens]
MNVHILLTRPPSRRNCQLAMDLLSLCVFLILLGHGTTLTPSSLLLKWLAERNQTLTSWFRNSTQEGSQTSIFWKSQSSSGNSSHQNAEENGKYIFCVISRASVQQ